MAATGRRPQRFDFLPQKGDVTDHQKADSAKIDPAIQSGRFSSRVIGGSTAAISIVLPAPMAMREKNSKKKAPRRSGRGAS